MPDGNKMDHGVKKVLYGGSLAIHDADGGHLPSHITIDGKPFAQILKEDFGLVVGKEDSLELGVALLTLEFPKESEDA